MILIKLMIIPAFVWFSIQIAKVTWPVLKNGFMRPRGMRLFRFTKPFYHALFHIFILFMAGLWIAGIS